MKYSISIITYTALNQAKRCVESVLANSDGEDFELILTANGNPAARKYFAHIAALHPETQIVDNARNLGFIEPSNNALTLASGKFFVMVNDDSTVPANWLPKLEQPFLDDPKCAISGAKGGCYTLDNNFVGYRGALVDFIECSCAMVRTDLVNKYGLFDEALKIGYAEDADLSLRLRSLGYTIKQADFSLENHVAGTTAATVPGITKAMRANFELCRKRWSHYLKTRAFT